MYCNLPFIMSPSACVQDDLILSPHCYLLSSSPLFLLFPMETSFIVHILIIIQMCKLNLICYLKHRASYRLPRDSRGAIKLNEFSPICDCSNHITVLAVLKWFIQGIIIVQGSQIGCQWKHIKASKAICCSLLFVELFKTALDELQ